jgi:hypothetical protein
LISGYNPFSDWHTSRKGQSPSGIGFQLGPKTRAQPRNRRRQFRGGVYALNLQSSAAAHPACALVLQWFAQQAKKEGDELIGP